VNIRHTPNTVAKPFGPYSHAVEVPEGSRLLYISGEVGVLPDGAVPKGIEAQAEACWRNITAILADAGMGIGDLVKITTYLVRPGRRGPGRRSAGKAFRRRPPRLGDNHRQSAGRAGVANRDRGSRGGEGLLTCCSR
jgi:enamine deaminase RidA (YjgF/YER057c/UK114 family)